MAVSAKKFIRTAQTYAGPLVECKGLAQRSFRKLARVPSDASYRAFRRLGAINRGDFLDIGANRGQTIASMRLYYSRLPIVAFEPNPILATKLSKRYLYDENVTIRPFGLGSKPGRFDLYIPYYRGFMFDGLASFDYESAKGWLNSDTIYRFDSRKLSIEKVTCEVRIWDELETTPTLVKIDVQGFEAQVLRGGLSTIRRHRPIFLIENDPAGEHGTVLERENYRRAAYENSEWSLDKCGFRNTFFVPEERIASLES